MIIQALPEMKQNLLQAANKKNFTTAADLFLEITKQNPSLSAEEQDYIDQKTTTSFPAANELLMLPRRNSIVNK